MGWLTLTQSCRRVATGRLGGVSVVAGAISGEGLLDQRSEMVIGEQVISLELTLTCETAIFGSLDYGDPITVDGTAYVVRQSPVLIGDGTDCVIPLQRITP